MLVSCRVTGPRRDPDISGDDVNINIALAAALYLISAGAGLHNQELHKQQPSPAQPRQLLRPGQRQQQSFCHYRRCLPRQPGLGCPLGPAQPGLYFVAHITAPARAARTNLINYNKVGAQIDFPIFYGDRSWCNTFSSHYLHLLRVTEERPEIIMALAISLIVYLGLDVSVC